jgi:hypothetical protein
LGDSRGYDERSTHCLSVTGRPEYLEQLLRAWLVPALQGVSGNVRTYSRLRAHVFVEDRAFARKLFSMTYAALANRQIETLAARASTSDQTRYRVAVPHAAANVR